MTRFHIGVGSKASFVGSRTNCPKCSRMVEIIPGVYDATADGLNVLIDLSISLEALGEIRRIVERLQQGDITVPEAKAEAENISPKAGKLFDIANWSDQAKATVLAAIIMAIATVEAAHIVSSNQPVIVQPAIEQIIQEQKPSLRNDLKSSSAITSPKIPIPKRKPKPPS